MSVRRIHPIRTPNCYHGYLLGLTVLLLGFFTGVDADSVGGRVFILGDSYSDTGNRETIRQANNEPEFDSHQFYYKHRSSNGPNWIDHLYGEESVSAALMEKPRQQATTNSHVFNYAVAGAASGDYALFPSAKHIILPVDFTPWGVMRQRSELASHWSDIGEDDQLVVYVGFNDIALAVESQSIPTWPKYFLNWFTPVALEPIDAMVAHTVDNIMDTVRWARDAGFGRVVIIGLAEGGTAPMHQSNPSAYGDAVRQFNSLLASRIQAIRSKGANEIVFVDIAAQLTSHLSLLSGSNRGSIPVACLVQGKACRNPEQHFFWDASHPTTRGHKVIAEILRQPLQVHSINRP